MDILIKRKNYKEALEFLKETSTESDWNSFNDAIKTNKEFLEYFKDFLVNLSCILRLKTFLLKIFYTNRDKLFQEIVYDIIAHLINSESEFSSNFLIKNLILIQTVKLVVLDPNNRSRLQDIIQTNSINDYWFIELLESFQFWTELGLLYELRGEYEKCLHFYKKTSTNEEKIKEFTQMIKINQKVNAGLDECDEENYDEYERNEKNVRGINKLKEEWEN